MIHAVIVLYNPNMTVYENILSYLNDVSKLYIIDNSDKQNHDLIKKIEKLDNTVYINLNKNYGIAYALNLGANMAIENQANFLLTMDQDSKAFPNMVGEMKKCLANVSNNEIGIVTPIHTDPYYQDQPSESNCGFILSTMTSGNLLNLDAYRQVGPFRDDFFIDQVDTEYCLRLNRYGYKVMIANHAFLHHNVGNISRARFFGRFVYPTNHSPLRRYYIARNRAKLIQLYYRDFPAYCFFEFKRQVIETIKIVLFESEKLLKLRMIGLGFIDFMRNRFGKFQR